MTSPGPAPAPGPDPDRDQSDSSPNEALDRDQALPADDSLLQIAAFLPGTLERQLRIDGLLRFAAAAALAVALGYFLALGSPIGAASSLAVLLLFIGWFALGMLSARTARQLPMIAAQIDKHQAQGEHMLALALKRRPLMRSMRLILYQRLAILRLRQNRHHEVTAICEAILAYQLGPARDNRPNLLLLLTESYLEIANLHGAFAALLRLHQLPLNLIESLQRLALQTRYEVLSGRYNEAIYDIDHKIHLSELMPATQCGAMHAMLATAADGTKQNDLAQHLWQRAKLFCTSEQLERVCNATLRHG
jgi:hypothetical protein